MIVWPEVMYDAAEIWRISHEAKEYIVLSFSAANPEKIDLQSNCHVGATTGVLCFCIDGFKVLRIFLGLMLFVWFLHWGASMLIKVWFGLMFYCFTVQNTINIYYLIISSLKYFTYILKAIVTFLSSSNISNIFLILISNN